MSNQPKYDEVLQSPSKTVCVIAGPGSGKTKGILIPKAQQVLADESIDPNSVVLLTFSRPSAIDLKNRVKGMDRVPRALTLHSLCLSFLLSEDNHDIKKRINSIVLDFEKDALKADLKLHIPSKNKREIGKMLDEFSAGWAVQPHDTVFDENTEKRAFKRAILNWLDEHEAALMEEIVYHAVDLAKKVSSSFIDSPKYIFVDEFQDLNKLEQEFIDLLGQQSDLVLVVGDPDQSIYSFKFAHPQGITDFAGRASVGNFSLEYTGRCAKKIVELGNQILKQADPYRTNLLKPLPSAMDGSVAIERHNTQQEEYDSIIGSIKTRLSEGAVPSEILVLVPKKKLGKDFVTYANAQSLPSGVEFHLSNKAEFSSLEQEKLLLFGLVANPNSILHIRSYIGLNDPTHFAEEIQKMKEKYGSLKDSIEKANPNDFEPKQKRVKKVCEKLIELKAFLNAHSNQEGTSPDALIDELLPENIDGLQELRAIVLSLKEDSDTISGLYTKLVDYLRTVETKDNQIKVMTLLASKGLEAEDVYILGCNDGNLPGANRSTYLSDFDYKKEQRRLLYVGITRAKKNLTITWCRYIPFHQAKGHHTATVGTVTYKGKPYNKVGLSEFLQDLEV